MSCGHFVDILWEKCGERVYFLNKFPTFSLSTNCKPAPNFGHLSQCVIMNLDRCSYFIRSCWRRRRQRTAFPDLTQTGQEPIGAARLRADQRRGSWQEEVGEIIWGMVGRDHREVEESLDESQDRCGVLHRVLTYTFQLTLIRIDIRGLKNK